MANLTDAERITLIKARACLKDLSAGWDPKELVAPIAEVLAELDPLIDESIIVERPRNAPPPPAPKSEDAWEVVLVKDQGLGLIGPLKETLNNLERRSYQVFRLEETHQGFLVVACNPSLIGSNQSKAFANMVAGLQQQMQAMPGFPGVPPR